MFSTKYNKINVVSNLYSDILCGDEKGEILLKEIHSKFLTRPKLHKVVWVELDEISLILKYNHQFYVVKMISLWFNTKINVGQYPKII